MPIVISESDINPQILVIKINGLLNREEWVEYLEDFKNIYDVHCKEGRIYIIWDLTDGDIVPLKWMHEKAKLLDEMTEDTKKYLIASSAIINNSVIRQIFNAFLGIYTNSRPLRITKDFNQALEFFRTVPV